MQELTEKSKFELAMLFNSVPKKQQTLEMCEAAIEVHSNAIGRVSKRFLSEELCAKAINSLSNAFFSIGEDQMTSNLLLLFFKKLNEEKVGSYDYPFKVVKHFETFKRIKLEDFITKEVASEMIKCKGKAILYLPKELRRDIELMKLALETDVSVISLIPQEYQTKELVIKAIEKGADMQDFNNDLIDDEVADLLVVKDFCNFRRLPRDKRTYERCLLAIENGLEFEDIPKKFYTQELFDTLTRINPLFALKVPSQFISREMLLNVAKINIFNLYSVTPMKDILDEEFCKEMVCKGMSLRVEWIRDFQTKEMVDIAINNSLMNIQYVKSEFMTRELVERVVTQRPDFIDLIDKKYLSEEICYLAVLNGANFHQERIVQFQSERIINHLIEQKHFKKYWVNKSRSANTISKVKGKFKTKELYKKVLKMDKYVLQYAPKEVIDEELCYEAVCEGLDLGQDYLKGHQSQRIANKAFHNDKDCYKVIEDRFKTKEMSMEAFEHDTNLIFWMPEEFQTEEMWRKCFEEDKDLSRTLEMKRKMDAMPKKFCTEDMFFVLLKKKCGLITIIPKQYRTPNLMMYVIEQDEKAIEYFTE